MQKEDGLTCDLDKNTEHVHLLREYVLCSLFLLFISHSKKNKPFYVALWVSMLFIHKPRKWHCIILFCYLSCSMPVYFLYSFFVAEMEQEMEHDSSRSSTHQPRSLGLGWRVYKGFSVCESA